MRHGRSARLLQSTQPDLHTTPPTASRSRWREVLRWLVAAGLIGILFWWGLGFQRQLWEKTEPIRFVGDVTNAYNQGRSADAVGLLHMYDHVAAEAKRRADGVLNYSLDYPPLRLTAAFLWYRWTVEHFPEARQWQNRWDFNLPLLTLNRGLLLLAALSTVGLVHLARRWQQEAVPCGRARGSVDVVYLVLAFALVWFSPAGNLIGFAWPQWDICVPAFFLAAVLAGCLDLWILAGILLGVGAMYKGQVSAGLPLMMLWPLVAGRWLGLVRLLAGLALSVGLIAAPFMFQDPKRILPQGVLDLAILNLIAWLLGILARRPRPWWIRATLLGLAGALCALGGGSVGGMKMALPMACAGVMVFLAGARLRPRLQVLAPAMGIAASIWLSAAFVPVSWNWLKVGLLFGTEHFQLMQAGTPSNLAAILQQGFRVRSPMDVAFILPATWSFKGVDTPITWGLLLRFFFAVAAILGGISAGIHFRRRSGKFFLAIALTWLAFVALLAQIHERYALYPALMSVPLVALGFRWAVAHLAIALIGLLPALQTMLQCSNYNRLLAQDMGPDFGKRLLLAIQATHPGIGYALITLTLVCLWCSLDLRRPSISTAPADA